MTMFKYDSYHIYLMHIPLEDIKLYNPQMSGETFKVPETKRTQYERIFDIVSRSFTVGIVGLRRVGKTVLVKQILNEMLRNGREIFYFSFDEERFATVETMNWVIRYALDLYDAPVIALDEIGRIPGWAGVIKKYHDTRGVIFILSGSESLTITKGKESLAGRIIDEYLPPLQFPEFIDFTGGGKRCIELSLIAPQKAFAGWERSGKLDDFLLKGGFPEIRDELDIGLVRRYVLNNCIEKIIFEDLPKVFDISNEHALYRLWEVIVRNPGMIFVANNLTDVLGMSKNTITRYLFYLQKSYLVRSIFREGSVRSRMRKGEKTYPITPCMSSLAGEGDAAMGLIAETAVLDRLQNGLGYDVSFYRDRSKREVDFIVEGHPIEVKYRRNITGKDLKSVIYYMRRNELKHGLVVTRETADVVDENGMRILLVPLDMMLQINGIDFGGNSTGSVPRTP